MSEQSKAEQAKKIEMELNSALAARAMADEKITTLRNMIAGVNLGVQLEKEIQDSKEEFEPVEE